MLVVFALALTHPHTRTVAPNEPVINAAPVATAPDIARRRRQDRIEVRGPGPTLLAGKPVPSATTASGHLRHGVVVLGAVAIGDPHDLRPAPPSLPWFSVAPDSDERDLTAAFGELLRTVRAHRASGRYADIREIHIDVLEERIARR
ncbi:hypothetical protein DW322_17075 [Rhodococcus rhodnii]|uniref:Uncharacterized protein n=2 Tax=Rhodococcus rhodnii TaxID=38312 RepID=R7WMC7_9NOCA|nr:hypothetical protein [Rhodococcus rhodnii]EOM75164.1 hypothetical protein Rrhod_3497 [Rhodococcus rhodnii LMG 5362]TXG91598.1 hypothetical protein DW322_17075 [Rhodococcus rhodnii]